MSEMTIAQPLAGSEVMKRVLHKIEQMLRQDCYLNPMAAYESFEATIRVDIKMVDCGRMPEVHLEVKEHSENPIDENNENFALEMAEASLGAAPPNQVRMDSDQEIPTLVEHGDGSKEVKGVKYRRRENPRPAASEI